MIEQRDYKRLDLGGSVRLRTSMERPRVFRAYLDDISFGGFQVYAKERINLGDDIDFEIMTRLANYPLRGKGKVRHVSSIKKGKASFFSMGAEFTDINKKKIITLIDKILWYKSIPVSYRRHKREIYFVLKLLPFVILITWSVLKITDTMSVSINKEREYEKKFNEATIYYLYNRH